MNYSIRPDVHKKVTIKSIFKQYSLANTCIFTGVHNFQSVPSMLQQKFTIRNL